MSGIVYGRCLKIGCLIWTSTLNLTVLPIIYIYNNQLTHEQIVDQGQNAAAELGDEDENREVEETEQLYESIKRFVLTSGSTVLDEVFDNMSRDSFCFSQVTDTVFLQEYKSAISNVFTFSPNVES